MFHRVISTLAVVTIVTTAGVTLAARSKKADLTSTWRAGETVAIDGVNQEWEGRLAPIDKNLPASVGFYNDGDYIYFCLTTSDSRVRSQILRRGLIVWMDPNGGKKKEFGIEFPVGMQGMTVVDRSGDTGDGGLSQRPMDANEDRIRILGPGKNDSQDLSIDEVPGIQAKIGRSAGVLVYELKVPLRKTSDNKFAVGAAPNAVVGVGLETPEMKRPERAMRGGGVGGGEGGRGGWGGPGGMGGRGGMGRPGGMGGRGGYGGRGGEGGRANSEAAKPVKAWTTVQLASR